MSIFGTWEGKDKEKVVKPSESISLEGATSMGVRVSGAAANNNEIILGDNEIVVGSELGDARVYILPNGDKVIVIGSKYDEFGTPKAMSKETIPDNPLVQEYRRSQEQRALVQPNGTPNEMSSENESLQNKLLVEANSRVSEQIEIEKNSKEMTTEPSPEETANYNGMLRKVNSLVPLNDSSFATNQMWMDIFKFREKYPYFEEQQRQKYEDAVNMVQNSSGMGNRDLWNLINDYRDSHGLTGNIVVNLIEPRENLESAEKEPAIQSSKLQNVLGKIGRFFAIPTGELYELDEPKQEENVDQTVNKLLADSGLNSEEISEGGEFIEKVKEIAKNDPKIKWEKVLGLLALALPLLLTRSGSEETPFINPAPVTSVSDTTTPSETQTDSGVTATPADGISGNPSQGGDKPESSNINGGSETKPVSENPLPGVIEYPRVETQKLYVVKAGDNFRELAINVINEQEKSLGLSGIEEQERANITSQMASVMTLFQYAKTGNDPDILHDGDKIEFPNNQTLRDILDAVTNAEINPMDYDLINTTEKINVLNSNLKDPAIRRQQLLAVYKLMSQLGKGATVEQLEQIRVFINMFSLPNLVDKTEEYKNLGSEHG